MNCTDIKRDLNLYAAGELEHAEKMQVETHLASCAGCADLANKAQNLNYFLKVTYAAVPVSNDFSAKLAKRVPSTAQEKSQNTYERKRLWFMIPAAACFVIILAAIIILNSPSRGELCQVVSGQATIAVDSVKTEGHTGAIKLYDSSLVQLEKETEIKIDNPNTIRSVYLTKGTATFDVAKKPEPFIVKTKVADVKALGTKFTISIKQSEKDVKMSVTVAVLAGMVLVSNRLGLVEANQGEQISVQSDEQPKKEEMLPACSDCLKLWGKEGVQHATLWHLGKCPTCKKVFLSHTNCMEKGPFLAKLCLDCGKKSNQCTICGKDLKPKDDKELKFETVKGSHKGYWYDNSINPAQCITSIRDDKSLDFVTSNILSKDQGGQNLKDVKIDFDKESLIISSSGKAGLLWKIVKISKEDKKILVLIESEKYKMTEPFWLVHIVKLAKLDKPVEFMIDGKLPPIDYRLDLTKILEKDIEARYTADKDFFKKTSTKPPVSEKSGYVCPNDKSSLQHVVSGMGHLAENGFEICFPEKIYWYYEQNDETSKTTFYGPFPLPKEVEKYAYQMCEIQKLIEQLDHNDSQKRDSATEKLIKMGAIVKPFVEKALEDAKKTKNAEVKKRCKNIIDELEKGLNRCDGNCKGNLSLVERCGYCHPRISTISPCVNCCRKLGICPKCNKKLTESVKDLESKVTKLVDQLSNNSVIVRQSATSQLIEIGKDAVPFIKKALETSQDPETAARCQEILAAIGRK